MAGRNRPLEIWLLSDGAPGHLSQSHGLAEAVGRFRDVKVVEIGLQVRNRLLKSALRHLLRIPISLAQTLLDLAYKIEIPPGRPDLVISSGGNTLGANALLNRIFSVPNCYSGTLKGYPAQAYSLIFTVTSQHCANNVLLPLPPVPLSLTDCPEVPGADAPWLVLVGGDGAGYRYTETDWLNLAAALNRFSEDTGVRWLLTSSRRTGLLAEKVLAEALEPSAIAEAVYFGREPRPVVRDFLARCRGVLVTEDSLTMVAEAIYSGRPVISLQPKVAVPDKNDDQALRSYEVSGFLRRVRIAELSSVQLPRATTKVLPDVAQMIYAAIEPLLGGEAD